jgi:hypothetical protein
MIPGRGPDGNPILSVIAKRTYEIAPGKVTLADQQLPLNYSELPADPATPFYSEILAESDLVPFKPFTDIVVLGKAYTPKGKKAYHLDCEVEVGPARKIIRVYGERKVESKMMRGLYFTDPVPFETIEIGYSNAFGGSAKSKDGTLYPYPPNHLGKGFNLKGGFDDYSEIVVPCVEDPQSPIEPDHLVCEKFEDWKNLPKPASFGWTRQNFFPRFTYAGIIPELPGAYAAGADINPNLPKMDIRFFQGASEGLREHVLKGGERVRLVYMDPECPSFEFELPMDTPTISFKSGSDMFGLKPVLQTVLIDKEENLLSMVWRGSSDCSSLDEILLKQMEFSIE